MDAVVCSDEWTVVWVKVELVYVRVVWCVCELLIFVGVGAIDERPIQRQLSLTDSRLDGGPG